MERVGTILIGAVFIVTPKVVLMILQICFFWNTCEVDSWWWLITTHWPGDSDHDDGSDNLDRIKEYYWRPADHRGGEAHRNMRRTGPGSGSGKKVDCSWWRECCSWRRVGRAWPWPWRRWPGWRWWWRWRRHWRGRWWGGRPPGPSSPPTSGPWWPPAARLVQSSTIQYHSRCQRYFAKVITRQQGPSPNIENGLSTCLARCRAGRCPGWCCVWPGPCRGRYWGCR